MIKQEFMQVSVYMSEITNHRKKKFKPTRHRKKTKKKRRNKSEGVIRVPGHTTVIKLFLDVNFVYIMRDEK